MEPERRPETPAVGALVNVAVVPPAGAPGSEAAERQRALVEASRADRAALPGLAGELPWLSPRAPFACGHYLVTQGLRDLTGGPELELLNVPAAFVRGAAELLQTLARYLLTGGGALGPGQVIDLGAAGGVVLVTEAAHDEAEGGEGAPVLRVVLLD